MEDKLKWFGKVLEWVDKYGLVKIFKTGIAIIFISYVMIITLNPSIIYNRLLTYIEQVHTDKVDKRNEATIKIRYQLKELLLSTNADRAWVIEYHNGTSGLGGLPFTYGIMNMEECKEGISPVSAHYRDFLLSDYVSIIELSKYNYWVGNVEKFKDTDERLYYALKSNQVNNIAVFFIKTATNKDIGMLGLSYCKDIPEDAICKLYNVGLRVSILLNNI